VRTLVTGRLLKAGGQGEDSTSSIVLDLRLALNQTRAALLHLDDAIPLRRRQAVRAEHVFYTRAAYGTAHAREDGAPTPESLRMGRDAHQRAVEYLNAVRRLEEQSAPRASRGESLDWGRVRVWLATLLSETRLLHDRLEESEAALRLLSES